MPELTMVEAVRRELRALLAEDDRVVLLGEDVGPLGGVFRATDGLLAEFGEDRVIDTPMAELSIVGAAIGMALRGLRPIAEIQFGDFIWAAAEQILSEAAKMRFRTAGEWTVPMVVRATWGAGIHGGLYHSQSIEAVFAHYPGLKVVAAVRDLARHERRTPTATATAAGTAAPETYHDAGAPQATMVMPVDLGGLDGAVELTAHLIAAAAAALVDQPDANGVWTDDGVRRREGVHIAVVDADEQGRSRRLLVPDAEERSPLGIARVLERARAGGDADGAEATFTLVVPGGAAVFGLPRIPAGQTATVMAGRAGPAVVADGDGLAFRRQVSLSLAADHRVLDGAGSARFLTTMKRALEGA